MNKKVKTLLLLSFNLAFFIIASRILPIRFEDNDDISMAWIASGIYSGTPDCHLVFISAIFGTILKWLYTIIPSVEWYSVSFAFFHIVSMTVIIDFLDRLLKNKTIKCLLRALFYLLWTIIIIRFQFTTTAAITAFAATVLLYRKRFLQGGVLLFCSSLIRFSAAGLVGLLMAPALLSAYKTDIKRCYVPILSILLLITVIHSADSLFYSTPEWEYFCEFNSLRGKLNDNPNLWRADGHLPEGISREEYLSVCAFAIDPTITTSDDLKVIKDIIYNVPTYKKAKNIFPRLFKVYWQYFIAVAALLFCSAFLTRKNKKNIIEILGIYVFWVFVLSCITLNGSVKFRVFLTSLFPIIFYSVILLSGFEKNNKRKSIILIPIALLCLLFISVIHNQHQAIISKQALFNDQDYLVANSGDLTVIPVGADYMVEMYPPFKLSSSIASRKFINPYCMMASPLNSRFDSFDDLVDSEFVFLSKKEEDFSSYIQSIESNYGISSDTVVMAQKGNYSLIKITEK